MIVQVHLFAFLVQYAPGGEAAFTYELTAGARVSELLRGLGIPASAPRIILVNGRHATEDTPLRDGVEVVFMTPIEGG